MTKLSFQLITLCLLFLAAGAVIHAQSNQSVSIAFDPPFPTPGQPVTARAVLSGIESSETTFRWFINEKSISSAAGGGKDTLAFQLGSTPQTTINVIVTTREGNEFSATKTLTSQGAVIIWWADTYVPQWYLGKAVPSPASEVTILAIPGVGTGQEPKDLLYSWSINAETKPDISGVGKDYFTLETSRAKGVTHYVSVRISNKEQTIAQEAAVLITTHSPELAIYALLPAGGVASARALSSFSGNSGEDRDFVAVPFFFRPDHLTSAVYTWYVNNKIVSGQVARPNILTIQTNQGETSQNAVRVHLKSGDKNIQEEETAFIANFQ